jgi:hypothetical protein
VYEPSQTTREHVKVGRRVEESFNLQESKGMNRWASRLDY